MEYYFTSVSTIKQKGKIAKVINNRPILLSYTDNGFFAIRDKCPHMGSPLSTGTLKNGIITCKHHNLSISVETGEITDSSKADYLRLDDYSRTVTTYKVIVKDDSIYIDI